MEKWPRYRSWCAHFASRRVAYFSLWPSCQHVVIMRRACGVTCQASRSAAALIGRDAADVIGSLAGELADIGGDLVVAEFSGDVVAHDPHVQLAAPGQRERAAVPGWVGQGDGRNRCCGDDGSAEQAGVCPRRRVIVWPFGAVGADDGVDVDEGAVLVLDDLAERQAQAVAELASADARLPGQDRAAPARSGPTGRDGGVEQHRAGIAEAVRAQRLPDRGVAILVAPAAGFRLPVRA